MIYTIYLKIKLYLQLEFNSYSIDYAFTLIDYTGVLPHFLF